MVGQQVVSVFGGSTPLPGSADYESARRVGELLARAGFAVATGGYSGVMEAVSRGANEAGGRVIGVTSDRIERKYGRTMNSWVTERVHYPTLGERMRHLVEQYDAAIAMPGGIGTLAEVAYTWSMVQTGESKRKPLVLVGPRWQETMTAFLNETSDYIKEPDRRLITLVRNGDEAIKELKRMLST